jgi:uncharacterized protein (DUF433 family)
MVWQIKYNAEPILLNSAEGVLIGALRSDMSSNPITPPIVAPASPVEMTPGTCGGKPRIAGHRIRVQDIVIWQEQGRSADEIVADFPQLSLADVYSALAYYHDHREQIDLDIREDDEFIQRAKAAAGPGVLDRLRGKVADGGNSISSG